MTFYLLDTNHLGAFWRRVSVVRDRVTRLSRQGHRFATCGSVLCELEAGSQQMSEPAPRRRGLATTLDRVGVWPVDAADALTFGEVFLQLQRAARVLSHVDLLLAAFALQRGAVLLTTDRGFEALRDVAAENWRAAPPADNGETEATP